jgi:subtilase family serine protease
VRLKILVACAGAAVAAGASVVAVSASGGSSRTAPAPDETYLSAAQAVAISKPLGALPPSRTVHLTVSLTGRRPVAPGLRVTWWKGEPIAALDGPASAAESLFHVSFRRYVSPGGRSFYTADRTPTLPIGISGVTGLENWTRGHYHGIRPGGFSPQDTIAFYDIGPLRKAGLDGAGETIVLPEQYDPKMAPAIERDLAVWAAHYGVAPFKVTWRSDKSWGSVDRDTAQGALGEVALDLEVVHGIAPKAKLVVYLIADDPNLWPRSEAAMVREQPHAIISDSYGFPEMLIPNQTVANVQQAPWVQAAKQGMTHYVASGDLGAWDAGQRQPLTVDFPSALPAVTSVGGTTAFMSSDGGYLRELGWGSPLSQSGAGGGVSKFWARPSWQRGRGVLQSFSNGNRQVPDVAAVADSSTGYSLFFASRQHEVGGTSAAAPFWAAITALINQGLRGDGVRRVGFANPALYTIARTRPGVFHDITGGNNLYYSAAPGWDFVTGWGTPDATKLALAWERYLKAAGR